jgi:hypothetical protein
MRAIPMNLSRKIVKLQTNAGAPNANSQANICGSAGSTKAHIALDLQGFHALREKSHPRTRNAGHFHRGFAANLIWRKKAGGFS